MKRLAALGLAALAGAAAGIACAQDGDNGEATDAVADGHDAGEYLDRTPVDCISLPQLRDTTIVDDGTVLFYMRGGDVYLNRLERECFGLEASGRFITETRTTRLCSVDMLQVFRQFAGSTMPGAFCRLGDFFPITEAEAEQLEMDLEELAEARRSVVLTPIDPSETEEPSVTDAGSESEEAGP